VKELICSTICRRGLCDLLVVIDCVISYFIIFPCLYLRCYRNWSLHGWGGGGSNPLQSQYISHHFVLLLMWINVRLIWIFTVRILDKDPIISTQHLNCHFIKEVLTLWALRFLSHHFRIKVLSRHIKQLKLVLRKFSFFKFFLCSG